MFDLNSLGFSSGARSEYDIGQIVGAGRRSRCTPLEYRRQRNREDPDVFSSAATGNIGGWRPRSTRISRRLSCATSAGRCRPRARPIGKGRPLLRSSCGNSGSRRRPGCCTCRPGRSRRTPCRSGTPRPNACPASLDPEFHDPASPTSQSFSCLNAERRNHLSASRARRRSTEWGGRGWRA